MIKLPTETALIADIDYAISQLENVRTAAYELIRRREHEAGRDGFPSSSMGGGSNGGGSGSSTEAAALGTPIKDPIADYIDAIFRAVTSSSKLMEQARNCLSKIEADENQARFRRSSIETCNCCGATITLTGDDRKRRGFCNSCYRAWQRWRPTVADPTETYAFVKQRRDYLKTKASPSPVPQPV